LDDEFVEHVIAPMEFGESELLPLDLHVNLTAINSSNEFSIQENLQQNQEEFVVLDCFKGVHIHGMFSTQLKDIISINETKITEEKHSILNQLEFSHILHDPIANWMGFYFPRSLDIAVLSVQSICSFKCELAMKFLLQMYFCIFLCIQEVHVISEMILWLHWK